MIKNRTRTVFGPTVSDKVTLPKHGGVIESYTQTEMDVGLRIDLGRPIA